MSVADWVATYAAIVATGALALEIRRWFESGPNVYVKSSPDMTLVVSGMDDLESGILLVTAYNRGDRSTTITTMMVYKYKSILHKWLNRHEASFIIPHPNLVGPPNIPCELKPGGQWQGCAKAKPDEIIDLRNGRYWAGIHTTDRARPYLSRIPKQKDRSSIPPDAQIL